MPKGTGRANKWREMTPAEAEAAFLRHERDAIHRDWVEAEKVVDAARIAAPHSRQLREALSTYDAYIAEEKAKAAAPSGLPEKGLISQ